MKFLSTPSILSGATPFGEKEEYQRGSANSDYRRKQEREE
jgi:hypothetical protein